MSLLELYTQVILEYNRDPHNVGEISDADIDVKGYNKSCGDDIRMYVKLAARSSGKLSSSGVAVRSVSPLLR